MRPEDKIIFTGIVDKDLNPFSKPSWCREGKPEGSGRVMTKKRMQDFKKLLDKGCKIDEIKQPNFEKYPAFQAIRWGYAVIDKDRLIPTKKWIESGI